MDVYIYSLSDPITNEIRYIGKSFKPQLRFKNHIYQSKKLNSYIGRWINLLLNEAKLPILSIIEECNDSNWEEREIYWIDYYKKAGTNLCNIRKGGNQPLPKKPKKISKYSNFKGKYRSRFHNNGKVVYLGIFDTAQEAENAYNLYKSQGLLIKEGHKTKKIQMYNNHISKEFDSLTICAKYLNTSVTNISRCCKGKAKTHKGYQFKYITNSFQAEELNL